MRNKKVFYSLAILIVFIMVLTSACGGSTPTTTAPAQTTAAPTTAAPTTTKPPTTTTTAPTKTTAPTTTTAPTGTQVLNLNLGGEPATIDPNKASWSDQRTIISQCFRGLLSFDKGLNLIAETAKEIPTVANGGISADGLTYTFKLKPEVTWSDGKKVLAKDYIYGIKRMLSPEVASEYASFYFDIVGAEAYNAGTGSIDAVGVKAIGDDTVEIKLAQQRPIFLQLMALWPVYPTREDLIVINGDKWTEPGNYIGNGPYMLTKWEHQSSITVEANPNYWGPKPLVSKIVFKMIEDQNAAFAAYKNGELDIVAPPVGTEKNTMADPSLSKEIVRYAELTTFAFQFNVTKAPFDNAKVRQAFSCAVDRASFIDKVRGGVGKVALSWIPPGMPGYDANLGKDYEFNPTKAKQLLAEAGFSDASKLPAIKFTYNNSGANPTIAQFLQGQMKDNLGVNITLDPMEAKAFQQYVNSEQHQWAWFGWGADYPDPDNWLPEIFGTGAGNNHTLYSNPQFDALVEQAKHELDNTKRLDLLAQAHKMLMTDAPIVTMFYRERFVLVKPYVKGLTTTGMDGQIAGDQFYHLVSITK